MVMLVLISSFDFLSLLQSSSLEKDSSAVNGLDVCQKNRGNQHIHATHVMVFLIVLSLFFIFYFHNNNNRFDHSNRTLTYLSKSNVIENCNEQYCTINKCHMHVFPSSDMFSNEMSKRKVRNYLRRQNKNSIVGKKYKQGYLFLRNLIAVCHMFSIFIMLIFHSFLITY